MQFAGCRTKRCKQQSRSTASCIFLALRPRRPAEPWVQWEGDEAQPQLSQASDTAAPPYTSDSPEVGKTPFLQRRAALLAKGQADLSRAGFSFLGQIFSGFFFVFCWKALLRAYLVQHFKSSLLEENMLLT